MEQQSDSLCYLENFLFTPITPMSSQIVFVTVLIDVYDQYRQSGKLQRVSNVHILHRSQSLKKKEDPYILYVFDGCTDL